MAQTRRAWRSFARLICGSMLVIAASDASAFQVVRTPIYYCDTSGVRWENMLQVSADGTIQPCSDFKLISVSGIGWPNLSLQPGEVVWLIGQIYTPNGPAPKQTQQYYLTEYGSTWTWFRNFSGAWQRVCNETLMAESFQRPFQHTMGRVWMHSNLSGWSYVDALASTGGQWCPP